MAGIGNGVTLAGFFHEDSIYTFNLSGSPTVSDVGKLVTIDATAARTMKLTGNDEVIYGVLQSVEVRMGGEIVGAVAMKGALKVPTTGALTVGHSLRGSPTAGVAEDSGSVGTPTNFIAADVTGYAEWVFG